MPRPRSLSMKVRKELSLNELDVAIQVFVHDH